MDEPGLEDRKVERKLKLSAAWASVMLCYVYGDIFNFFKPGFVADIVAGKTGAMGTQAGLTEAAILMAIPSIMVLLCLILGARVNRWANLLLASFYTVVIIATMPGSWDFYLFLAGIEAGLTVFIIWLAWTWPRMAAAPPVR